MADVQFRTEVFLSFFTKVMVYRSLHLETVGKVRLSVVHDNSIGVISIIVTNDLTYLQGWRLAVQNFFSKSSQFPWEFSW